MRVDDNGIRVPVGVVDRLGVEFGGRRIWAFSPRRDARRSAQDGRVVGWPVALIPYLNGRADVVVRSLETGMVLFEDTVAFGDGDGAVEIVDRNGNPLTVDKSNHLTQMFGEVGDEDRRLLVDTVARCLELLRGNGHDAFLAYGNLLGAVRDGALIGHDNDADVVYLAKATHPLDVILESIRIEREFLEAGWQTTRMSGGTFKLWTAMPDGTRVGIDVFTAFYFQDLLHIMPTVAAPVPRDALLPTSTVTLEGRELPAPARPEALVEATYGSGWRVPDPSFKYSSPTWLRRRMTGLFRGERRHVTYWDEFYARQARAVPTEPSAFACWVVERDPRPTALVDIGSGTGRDSLWLSEQGIRVLGCDYSKSGVHYAAQRAAERGSSAAFRRLNLYDLRQMLATAARLAYDGDMDAVYARFLVHALEDEGRQNLWRFSRSVLSGTQGRIYLEFRTEATEHEFGEHFRRFVQPGVVRAELESYGFDIEHCEDRHGLAVHHSEDPRVCRIIARRKR
jgi:hypothetical protein